LVAIFADAGDEQPDSASAATSAKQAASAAAARRDIPPSRERGEPIVVVASTVPEPSWTSSP
jgi:hypothetical protein